MLVLSEFCLIAVPTGSNRSRRALAQLGGHLVYPAVENAVSVGGQLAFLVQADQLFPQRLEFLRLLLGVVDRDRLGQVVHLVLQILGCIRGKVPGVDLLLDRSAESGDRIRRPGRRGLGAGR